MLIGGSYDTLATTIYLQVTGAYDSTGAAAMSVVLLSLTVILFLIQKYYLEKKTAATLTGKASRMRMLIEDKERNRSADYFLRRGSSFRTFDVHHGSFRRTVHPLGQRLQLKP